MINRIIEIVRQAGQHILEIYNQPLIDVQKKVDDSALTQADIASHEWISNSLKKIFPEIPIVSEESSMQYSYDIRKNWEYFFLVDPLDGTKEFIKRNDEFTVNIALIEKDTPVLGVIHVPVSDVTYYAEKGKGAYKIIADEHIQLLPKSNLENVLRVLISRSHMTMQTEKIIAEFKKCGNKIIILSAGSALKFGMIAEGSADVYPRCAPTMEWDTAAGQIIVEEVGKHIISLIDGHTLKYNKFDLRNQGFIVQ